MSCFKKGTIRLRHQVLDRAMLTLLVLGTWGVALTPNPARAAGPINACGTISSNTVWTAGNVYVINNCATVVATGVTLTVQPGTVVKFAAVSDVLLVQGTLLAQGTAGAPIAFTSLRDDSHGDDTNGDGASTGHAGDWSSLRFAAGSHGRLENVFLGFGGSGAYDYAGRYTQGMLESFSTDVTLDHVTLRNSAKSGLYCDNASVRVTFGQVSDNLEYGLYWNGVDAAVPLVVSDTTFSGNGAAGWLHFRDAAGTVTLERNAAAGGKNGFRADGRVNQGSLTWNNRDGLPLLVSGGLTTAPATTLPLKPGSVVKFADYYDVLVIQGRLDAQGTAEMWLDVT